MGAEDVRMVGKPHPLIDDACRDQVCGSDRRATSLRDSHASPRGLARPRRAQLVYAGLPNARVACVGDSLHHDVLGAAANELDSIFICGGVHYKELGVPQAAAAPPEPAKLSALLDAFAAEHDGCTPTHVLAGFCL